MFSKNLFLLFIGSWVWFSGMQAMEAWGLENSQEHMTQAMEVNITEETQESTVQAFNDDDLITILFTHNIEKRNSEKEYDDTLATIELDGDVMYRVARTMKVPYNIIKSCSVLCNNISLVDNTITIPSSNLSAETFSVILDFLKTCPMEQLEQERKIQEAHNEVKHSEQKLFELFRCLHLSSQSISDNTNPKILQAIKILCQQRAYRDRAVLDSIKSSHNQTLRFKKSIEHIYNYTDEDLFKLLDAANYLDCSPLYDIAIQAMLYKLEYLTLHTKNLHDALTLIGKIEATDHYFKIFEYSCDNIRYHDKIKTVKSIQALEGHSSPVHFLCFSPDNKILASGSSYDNTFKLWDVNTGVCLKTLKGSSKYGCNCEMYSSDFSVHASTSSIDNPGGKKIKIAKFHNLKKEFSLATLFFLQYLIDKKE